MDSPMQGSKSISKKRLENIKSLAHEESSVGTTSASIPYSPSTWAVEKKKRNPNLINFIAMDVIDSLKGCFSIKTEKDERDANLDYRKMSGSFLIKPEKEKSGADLQYQEISAPSLYTDRFLCQSPGTFASPSNSWDNEDFQGGVLENFTMNEIRKATRNFSTSLKIGQGGFGSVYKGRLKDGRMVAIKRAQKSSLELQLSMEFVNEMTTLSKVEHLNLVKLMGFLEEKSERILIFEYVSNGNLRQHLDGEFGSILNLEARLDIAIDVARGLTYLHLYADQSFIHRDVKSSNVLLTDKLRAKLADFRFSRLGPCSDIDISHVTTQLKGTVGYIDPEYIQTNQLSQRSDVYSFGVLLLEIISGRRPIEPKREMYERITLRWAFELYIQGETMDILDPKLECSRSAIGVVGKFIDLAFQCASPSKKDRPTMIEVVETLWNIKRGIHHNVLQPQPS